MQAVLRCRHCSNQFVLGEMVEAELGFWEVVSDPQAPQSKEQVASEPASSQLEAASEASSGPVVDVTSDVNIEAVQDTAVIELAKEEYVSPQTLLKSQAEKKKTDWSKFEPITHEQYERMRRKGKSPVWSMLSILLGGLASIPIATLLIWHVLGKDPLQMGPVVARFAPWIVPTRFRPSNFADEPRAAPPPAGASGFRRFDSDFKDSSTISDSPSDSTPVPAEEASNPAEDQSSSSTPAQGRPSRLPGNRSAPRAFPAPSISSELADDAPAEDIPPDEPKDVFTAIHLVERDLEAWNERGEDRDLQKKLALQTYSNMAALALAIHQLPSPSPIRRLVRSEMNSIGQQVTAHADIQQLIQGGARYWLANHKEDLVGMAIVVKAASASEGESMWQVTPSTALGEEALAITVPKEICPALADGQNILAIGCLTREKPAVNAESKETTPKSSVTFTASYVHVLKP
ncbi:MAG: hypothetical protein SFV81_04680 [Pirellulaceae bacterium]|nr:hypothetical protein [Pirellulaceae bacterium]